MTHLPPVVETTDKVTLRKSSELLGGAGSREAACFLGSREWKPHFTPARLPIRLRPQFLESEGILKEELRILFKKIVAPVFIKSALLSMTKNLNSTSENLIYTDLLQESIVSFKIVSLLG